jgi:hypothetical protein
MRIMRFYQVIGTQDIVLSVSGIDGAEPLATHCRDARVR